MLILSLLITSLPSTRINAALRQRHRDKKAWTNKFINLGHLATISYRSYPSVDAPLPSLSLQISRVSNGPCLIDIGEDKIVTEMPGFSKSTVEWAAIKRYREAGKVLMLYVTRSSFIVIP
jgi:hypothetical protein